LSKLVVLIQKLQIGGVINIRHPAVAYIYPLLVMMAVTPVKGSDGGKLLSPPLNHGERS
jgi:hypothetical protein